MAKKKSKAAEQPESDATEEQTTGTALAVIDAEIIDAEIIDAEFEVVDEDGDAVEGEASSNEATAKPPAPTDAELLANIHVAHVEVLKAKFAWDVAKEKAKECKAAWESANLHLSRVIGEGPNAYPLFEQTAAKTPVSAETWRSVDIDELGISSTLTERLRENEIDTMGELEIARANGLTKLDGIGQSKADVIEDAILKWLDQNRDSK